MYIYRIAKDNEAYHPWNLEYEFVFDIQFFWNQWLIGVSYWDRLTSIYIGPFTVNYYCNKK